jgi:hypothetical protein
MPQKLSEPIHRAKILPERQNNPQETEHRAGDYLTIGFRPEKKPTDHDVETTRSEKMTATLPDTRYFSAS